MIIGRIVAGLGTGMNTTAIPMSQSETSQAKQRGKLIIIQLVLVLGGIVITNWMNFGFTFAPDTQVSWRFPLAFQDFFAILTILLIPFLPESPRWLVMKGRRDETRITIARLLAKPQDHQQVIDDLNVICDSVARAEEQGNFGWREVFRNGKKQTFRRILLGAGPSFMQQMGGTNVVAYYLPVVLVRSFGFSNRLALILSACDSISLMFWGSMATFPIERVGRKNLMLMGAFTQPICFCMAGMGLSFNTNKGSILAVTFIFLYYVFYVSTLPEIHQKLLTPLGSLIFVYPFHVPIRDQLTTHAEYRFRSGYGCELVICIRCGIGAHPSFLIRTSHWSNICRSHQMASPISAGNSI
jgi:Sugar (and other) transporter